MRRATRRSVVLRELLAIGISPAVAAWRLGLRIAFLPECESLSSMYTETRRRSRASLSLRNTENVLNLRLMNGEGDGGGGIMRLRVRYPC